MIPLGIRGRTTARRAVAIATLVAAVAGLAAGMLPAGAALAQTALYETALYETPLYETVRYDRVPLGVTLPVGRERLVVFPAPVQFGMPPALATRLRVQAVGDTLYLKALAPFPATRAAVRGLDDGRIILLDLEGRDAEPGSGTDPTAADLNAATPAGAAPAGVVAGGNATTTLRVVFAPGGDEAGVTAVPAVGPGAIDTAGAGPAGGRVPAGRAAAPTPTAAPVPAAPPPAHGYAALTRMAFRAVYAPARLADGLPGVAPVPFAAEATTALVRGGALDVTPVAAWRAMQGLYVTALALRNRTPEPIAWDPRLLRGRWRTAAAVHPVLAPAGEPADTTAVVLIHDRPFAEAAAPWTAARDRRGDDASDRTGDTAEDTTATAPRDAAWRD